MNALAVGLCGAGAAGVAGLAWHAWRRVMGRLGRLDRDLARTRADLARLDDAVRVLTARQQLSERATPDVAPVDAALRLVAHQPDPSSDELVAAFGLSRAEAELLVRMHRPRPAGPLAQD